MTDLSNVKHLEKGREEQNKCDEMYLICYPATSSHLVPHSFYRKYTFGAFSFVPLIETC
jgi:hypothetical protein